MRRGGGDHDAGIANVERPDAVGDRQARARPFDRRLGGNPLQRLHRQRLVALVIEPADRAPLVMVADDPNERRHGAAVGRGHGLCGLHQIERLERHPERGLPAGSF
jgi:hypothetical protein